MMCERSWLRRRVPVPHHPVDLPNRCTDRNQQEPEQSTAGALRPVSMSPPDPSSEAMPSRPETALKVRIRSQPTDQNSPASTGSQPSENAARLRPGSCPYRASPAAGEAAPPPTPVGEVTVRHFGTKPYEVNRSKVPLSAERVGTESGQGAAQRGSRSRRLGRRWVGVQRATHRRPAIRIRLRVE